jgi:hypothetical protein
MNFPRAFLPWHVFNRACLIIGQDAGAILVSTLLTGTLPTIVVGFVVFQPFNWPHLADPASFGVRGLVFLVCAYAISAFNYCILGQILLNRARGEPTRTGRLIFKGGIRWFRQLWLLALTGPIYHYAYAFSPFAPMPIDFFETFFDPVYILEKQSVTASWREMWRLLRGKKMALAVNTLVFTTIDWLGNQLVKVVLHAMERPAPIRFHMAIVTLMPLLSCPVTIFSTAVGFALFFIGREQAGTPLQRIEAIFE